MITEQEIDRLTGRELDIAIEQTVMGHKTRTYMAWHGERHEFALNQNTWPVIPEYHLDVSASFDVLEDKFPWPEYQIEIRTDVNGNWRTCITHAASSSMFVGVDKSICVAIGRATIKAEIGLER